MDESQNLQNNGPTAAAPTFHLFPALSSKFQLRILEYATLTREKASSNGSAFSTGLASLHYNALTLDPSDNRLDPNRPALLIGPRSQVKIYDRRPIPISECPSLRGSHDVRDCRALVLLLLRLNHQSRYTILRYWRRNIALERPELCSPNPVKAALLQVLGELIDQMEGYQNLHNLKNIFNKGDMRHTIGELEGFQRLQNEGDSPPTTAGPTFPRFPDLPRELQAAVFEFAISPYFYFEPEDISDDEDESDEASIASERYYDEENPEDAETARASYLAYMETVFMARSTVNANAGLHYNSLTLWPASPHFELPPNRPPLLIGPQSGTKIYDDVSEDMVNKQTRALRRRVVALMHVNRVGRQVVLEHWKRWIEGCEEGPWNGQHDMKPDLLRVLRELLEQMGVSQDHKS